MYDHWRSAHSLCWLSILGRRGLILLNGDHKSFVLEHVGDCSGSLLSQGPGGSASPWGPLCCVPYSFSKLNHWVRRLGIRFCFLHQALLYSKNLLVLAFFGGLPSSPLISPHPFVLQWRDCSFGITLGGLQLGSLPCTYGFLILFGTTSDFSNLTDH